MTVNELGNVSFSSEGMGWGLRMREVANAG